MGSSLELGYGLWNESATEDIYIGNGERDDEDIVATTRQWTQKFSSQRIELDFSVPMMTTASVVQHEIYIKNQMAFK